MKTKTMLLLKVWGIACLLQCLFFNIGFAQVESGKGIFPYLPIITEISPFGTTEERPWIELYNPSSKEVDASRLTLVINDDFSYSLPKQLTKIPPRSFIVLQLDGKERQNIYTFKRNILILHSPPALKEAMRSKIGQIAVYESTEGKNVLVDFVSWGAPGSSKSLTKERDQIWKKRQFVIPQPSFGDFDAAIARKMTNYAIGRYWGSYGRDVSDWVVYSEAERTAGAANRVPRVSLFTLSDNATVRSEDIAIGWTSGAYVKSFKFQIATDSLFQQVIEEVVLTSGLYKPQSVLPEGIYYYRVKVIDRENREGEWSKTNRLISKKMRAIRGDGSDGASEKLLTAMQYRRQRKDSPLLCLDGCASDLDASTVKHWDNIHPDAVPISGVDHGDMNCFRASTSMMVSFYGKSLCQDRIAYFTEEENPGVGNGIPEGDLAHEVGMSYASADGGEETVALEWALDATTTFMDANPTFAQIQAWIDANQPIMTRKPYHLRTMNGYRIDDASTQWVHIMDPWSGERWETYTTWISTAQGTWVGPVSAPTARNDETTIWTDSDGDGVMDFDEQIRFMTGRFDKDSDNDGVEDKNDIREYVFNAADAYSKRNADFDLDGVRKENDPDNDGDTFNDGCEDKNFNGKYEPALGETNNFAVDATGACVEKPIHAIVVFDRSGSMVYPPSDPVKKYDRSAEAATLFLDTWLANDVPANTKVGLVFYDHTSYFSIAAGANTTLDLLTVDKRDNIVAAFTTNRPNYGCTSIGGGISKAMEAEGFNVSGIPVDDQHRVMIVLTDGMENTPPYMDDPAVTSALSTNKVDGFVLGIGDETEIDVDKLNDLADILNHPPASLATDMDAFQLEKFFLQVLAETQGMEFSTDPVEEIDIGSTRTRTVQVNNGAKRVTFVIAWNELNGRITFTLKDPNGHPVTADVTKLHERYQVSVKRNPLPGLWTLTVNASVAGSPAPVSIHYSLMSLEKNTIVRSNFFVHGKSYITGTPLLLTADLSNVYKPVLGAVVKVDVIRPRIGMGSFVSSAKVLVPSDLKLVEKNAVMSTAVKKLMIMSGQRMSLPVTTETVMLNDDGRNGDEIAGDGRYSAYFNNTSLDGVYYFRFIAASPSQRVSTALSREKLISVPISAVIYPTTSIPNIKVREYRPDTKETYIKFLVTPRDRFNNKIGPGKEHLIATEVKGKVIKIVDMLDGSYEIEITVNGKYDSDILVLPVKKAASVIK